MRSTSPSSKPGLEQPLRGAAAHEALRARAGVDPDRLDADDAAYVLARRRGDPDQRHHLLRRELRHRRTAVVRIARRDVHLGEQRVLPLDDVARDVLRKILDEECVVVDDALDRLLEELGEAGHVDALLRRVEVDRAVDRRGDQLLARGRRPIRTAFWTPVTPARDRPSAHLGGEACRSWSMACRLAYGTVRPA